MELKLESNAQLLSQTKILVLHLNEKTLEFLERLREIDHCKLHLERGYPSLFLFVTEELGFSSASAMRRINSMRLLNDLPEIKSQLSSGTLNLTTVSQTQQLFKKEKYSREAKLDLLMTLECKSTREVEKVLAKRCPEVASYDRMKPLSLNQNEVKFIADDSLVKKLERLKALKSHSITNLNELFNTMADGCLEKWGHKIYDFSNVVGNPKTELRFETATGLRSELKTKAETCSASLLKPKAEACSWSKLKPKIETISSVESKASAATFSSVESKTKAATCSNSEFKTKSETFLNFDLKPISQTISRFDSKTKAPVTSNVSRYEKCITPAPNRYISRKLKEKIFARDKGRCQYIDPINEKKCLSQYFVQLDHIQPFALGGTIAEENLRLYWSAHNQWQGFKLFGWGSEKKLEMNR